LKPVLLALAITAAVFAAGFCRIADLDFWWHLQTGKQIAASGDIPRQDIYSYTARGREYIDHEWLFQLSQYGLWSAFGAAGVAAAKCIVFSAVFALAALYGVRLGAHPLAVFGMTLLAIAGGVTRLIERPEMFTLLFAVLTFILLDRGDRRALVALPLICALWANIHAAVIVGLVIQALYVLITRRWVPLLTLAASAAAALLNPFGYRVLTVPFELTRIISSGVVNNEEWRHPTFLKTPFFFVALAATLVALIRPARPFHIVVAAFLAFISLRYIRNVGLFCAFVPMLTAPALERLRGRWIGAVAAAGAASLAFILFAYYPFQRGVGEASYFPDGLARYTIRNDLRGNMLNSYGFGGYLIWTLWPGRPVFIDGRNEVYLPLMQRIVAARRDSRAWNALLADYRIEYALLEYVAEFERVTIVGGGTKLAAVSSTRFPRSRWALVEWDDDGMIFVKRNGVNPIRGEYTAVQPEAWEIGPRATAISELERKLAEDPGCLRARRLLAMAQNR
jgi:hypothetical protein